MLEPSVDKNAPSYRPQLHVYEKLERRPPKKIKGPVEWHA